MELETTTAVDAPIEGATAGTPEIGSSEPAPSGNSTSEPAGQPRDEHGRFATYGTAPDSTDGETPGQAAPEGDGNADPDAAAPAAQAADPSAPAAPPAPEEAETPFTITHRGQEYGLQGARLDAEGNLRVARESVPQLRNMLASAREYQTVGRQREQHYQRELAALSSQLEARHTGIERLSSIIEAGDDVEAVAAFLELRQKWPQMKHESETARLKAENEALRRARGESPEPNGSGDDAQEIVQQVTQATAHHLTEIRKAVPEYAGLSEADMQEIAPKVQRLAYVYVREATPDDEMLYGKPAGSPIYDLTLFSEVFASVAAPVLQKKERQAAEARARAAQEQAKKANAARVQQPNTPPPAAGTKVGTPPTKGGEGKISKDDWTRMKGG